MDENEDSCIRDADRNSKLGKLLATLKFVFLAEHLSGIYRFSFKDGQIIPMNWIKKLHALSLIIWYVGFYLAFILPIVIDGNNNLVEVIDEIPIVFVLILYVTTVITTNTYFTKANNELFMTFADLDVKLITPGNNEFYVKARAKTNKYLFILLASHVVISITDLATEKSISPIMIIILPLYLSQKIEIVVFCLAIEMLKSRLDVINGFIAKFLDEIHGDKVSVFTVYGSKEVVNETFNMIGRPSTTNTRIRDLATMYETIGALCSLVNRVFNFQIFMTLVSTFTYIVITIWTSLYYYRTPGGVSSGPLITIVIWCFTTLLMVAVMCFVCERLRSSRSNTKILVNEIIMDYNLPKTMRVQAKAFMELIEAWPLSILIYDMFTVDITLMLNFISVSTTYLIVIIQISHFA